MIRDYRPSDQEALSQLALKAFEQYRDRYQPWEEFSAKIAGWTNLAETAQLILGEEDGTPLGAVALVPPNSTPNSHFPPDWAAIRMLVVDPVHRGRGIGKRLTEECLQRARALNCTTIGLHTSPIMEVALAMYLKMGFIKEKDIAPIHQVAYGVYRLKL